MSRYNILIVDKIEKVRNYYSELAGQYRLTPYTKSFLSPDINLAEFKLAIVNLTYPTNQKLYTQLTGRVLVIGMVEDFDRSFIKNFLNPNDYTCKLDYPKGQLKNLVEVILANFDHSSLVSSLTSQESNKLIYYNPSLKMLSYKNHKLILNPTQAKFIESLLASPRKYLPKEELAQIIYGTNKQTNLYQLVYNLKNRLKTNHFQDFILEDTGGYWIKNKFRLALE